MSEKDFQLAFQQALVTFQNDLTSLAQLHDNAPNEQAQVAMSASVANIFHELREMEKRVKSALYQPAKKR